MAEVTARARFHAAPARPPHLGSSRATDNDRASGSRGTSGPGPPPGPGRPPALGLLRDPSPPPNFRRTPPGRSTPSEPRRRRNRPRSCRVRPATADGRSRSTAGARSATARRPSVGQARRLHEREGFRPDRAAMWAVMLGFILVLVAATSSHAATFTHTHRSTSAAQRQLTIAHHGVHRHTSGTAVRLRVR